MLHVPSRDLIKSKALPYKNRRQMLKIAAGIAAPAILGGWSHGFVGYDVILQIGDSNSYAGLNTDGSASYDPAVDTTNLNCVEWRSANRNPFGPGVPFFFSIIANSFHPFDYAPPGQLVVPSATNGVGPGENFVKAWQTNFAAPGRKTMIVTLGVGGTGLCNTADTTNSPTSWQATPVLGNYLQLAIQKVNLVLTQSSLNKLVAILWTCGANDAIWEAGHGLTQATYQTAFQAVDTYCRANVTGASASTFAWLIQSLVPAWAPSNGPNTNAALANLPNIVSKCGYADPAGHTVLGQTANAFHLNAAAQRLIGSTLFINAYNSRSA